MALGIVLLAAPAIGFPRPDPAAHRRFEFEVRELVFAGLRGDQASLEAALAKCEEALAADPENFEALVWRGSTKVALSGFAYRGGDLHAGSQLWEAGMDEMARAAASAPDRVEVLIPRAATLLGAGGFHPFPAESRRLYGVALDAYAKVYELQQPYFERMSTHARGELLMSLVDAHLRVDEWSAVRPYLEQTREALPGTSYAEEAIRLLELARNPPAKVQVKTCHGCHQAKDDGR